MELLDLREARLVFDGNSITAGTGTVVGDQRIGEQVQYQLARQGIHVTIENYAVSGQTTAQMISDASFQLGSSTVQRDRPNIIIVNEGGNTIGFGGTFQQAFEEMRDYCRLRRSEGYYVMLWDCLPRNQDAIGYNAAQFSAAIDEYNRLVASNWKDFCDVFLPIRKELPQIQIGSFWYWDTNIHPSATANAYIAAKVVEYLKRIPKRLIRLSNLLNQPTIGTPTVTAQTLNQVSLRWPITMAAIGLPANSLIVDLFNATDTTFSTPLATQQVITTGIGLGSVVNVTFANVNGFNGATPISFRIRAIAT